MTNPYKNIDKAFSPFFTDKIGYVREGEFNSSFIACVFPEEDQTPFLDTSSTSDLKTISVSVPMFKNYDEGWNREDEPIEGDLIFFENKEYKVMSVSKVQDIFEIKARG